MISRHKVQLHSPKRQVESRQVHWNLSSSRSKDFMRQPLFQLVYLSDSDQSVEVEEVEEVDFTELKMRLDEGKSVFITRRENEKLEVFRFDQQDEDDDTPRHWYVSHI